MSNYFDPEELNITMLEKIFKTPLFLEMSSGQTSHMYQIFVVPDLSKTTPLTVQELLEKSFLDFGIKLKNKPKVLILQMPRYETERVLERIIPSVLLDITDTIENGNVSNNYPIA